MLTQSLACLRACACRPAFDMNWRGPAVTFIVSNALATGGLFGNAMGPGNSVSVIGGRMTRRRAVLEPAAMWTLPRRRWARTRLMHPSYSTEATAGEP